MEQLYILKLSNDKYFITTNLDSADSNEWVNLHKPHSLFASKIDYERNTIILFMIMFGVENVRGEHYFTEVNIPKSDILKDINDMTKYTKRKMEPECIEVRTPEKMQFIYVLELSDKTYHIGTTYDIDISYHYLRQKYGTFKQVMLKSIRDRYHETEVIIEYLAKYGKTNIKHDNQRKLDSAWHELVTSHDGTICLNCNEKGHHHFYCRKEPSIPECHHEFEHERSTFVSCIDFE